VQQVATAHLSASLPQKGQCHCYQQLNEDWVIGVQAAQRHLPVRKLPGCHLYFVSTSIDSATSIDVRKPKRSLLPLLIFLFLLSYGLLTLLVVEQDRTIASQRATIKQLLSDSSELAAAKRNAAGGPAQGRPDPQSQSPVGKEKHKDSRRSHRQGRPMPKFVPEKPPMPTSDAADERRAPISI